MEQVKIEYRVRKMERYFVTRYEERSDPNGGESGGSSGIGEYDNPEVAYEVAYALCKIEHEKLGWPPGDERIQYPEAPRARLDVASVKIGS